MMNNSKITALILALGLLALGLCIKSGIDNMAARDRIVRVRGLAERTEKADQVTWPVSYSITGNELTSLYEECKAKDDVLMQFLTSNGIPREAITVNPPDVYDSSTNEWASTRATFRYKLTSTMTVLTDKVDKVRELLNRQGELLTRGIAFNNSEIRYEYTKLNDIKPDMIAEATRNARTAAEQFAEDSDSKLGKIQNAEQGYFTIDDADYTTPYIKHIRVVTNVSFFLEN